MHGLFQFLKLIISNLILTFNALKLMDKNPKGSFFQCIVFDSQHASIEVMHVACHCFFSVPYSKWKGDNLFWVQNSLYYYYYYYFSLSICFIIVYPHQTISEFGTPQNSVPACNAGLRVWDAPALWKLNHNPLLQLYILGYLFQVKIRCFWLSL